MYEFILLTGIAAVVINLNPLIKLDGYYLLTEIIEIPESEGTIHRLLVELVAGQRCCALPIEVPVVPRRRVALFTIYCIASGLYSYPCFSSLFVFPTGSGRDGSRNGPFFLRSLWPLCCIAPDCARYAV